MLYRRFGKTDEMVSILGFGCMRLPLISKNDPTSIDEKKSTDLIRFAIDQGVNYIDTAYPYHGKGMRSGGQSEPFLAKVLKDGYRDKVKLATKLPSWLIKTREDMDKYLNDQLKRLETDHIDFYLLHALNKDVWNNLKKNGVDEFLDSALKDGRIKYAGFSFHDKLDAFKEIADYYNWSFCQIQYNYLDENFQAGKEGLRYASKKDFGITIMEPLRGGKLVNSLPGEAKIILNKANNERTLPEWALKWVWNHPEVSVVLSGMNDMSQVVENIKIANNAAPNSMTEDEFNAIDEVKDIVKQKTKVNCTACEYCMPCPVGVNIPGCFSAYNDHYIFNMDKLDSAYNRLTYSQKASNCRQCGKCESHCPQKIEIRKKLKKVKTLFE
ncbi:MAG: aldo/keto reductase [Clostridium tyrobutyricum]|jgi:predicted aldo/keto reductase-like oxidoreductase|uniref:aldo/keto reductase n=1 Tax=Clostridium tyrobutyricum TaxID=1519 RepID=UPI00243203DC|nr:aldo/keto reductase [Clostridium tyrobutyricum]MCH4200365.1 aldo/keto reductase [Clostridium tyrobutyricum]MCH4237288.1 aldo/keto reductase [Clostridium tyrobutyricum]MCH4260069.1 aldo/keto reductase [Clostridium tyrobutyricum]MCI1240382.1 aldo/keto reductase [Clostridium tyrobutyricum]MCI1652875.1 aldo/keto reductase [Clostridium tyrobutyricum]